MEPSKWQYLIEGGENAIYEQTTASGSLHDRQLLLLRIRKQDLAISDQVVSFHTTKAFDKKAETVEDDNDGAISYLEQVVAPLLEPYIDIPITTHLKWSFVKALKQQAIDNGCIPDARESSWNFPPERNQNNLCPGNMERHVRAQLIPDYRMLPMAPTDQPSYTLVPSTALSVELKPKAGYLAFSPLVQPEHRIKYQHSRYVLKQKLYQLEQQEVIRSGWSCGQVQQSHFDPLDLYSGNPERMQKAIKELFRCPQNNLRVTCNKELFLSKGKDGSPAYSDSAEVVCKDILSKWIGGVGSLDFQSTILTNICDWLVGVFQQEDVLQRLQRLQKLDIVDADGAILLYDRLVELCNGSHEEAQSLLDNVTKLKTTDEKSPLEDSPFAWSANNNDDLLPTICLKVKEFERKLLEVAPKLPSQTFLDHHHEEMITMIQSLDISGCQYLLLNWLLSLTLNDISMFVTFQKVTLAAESNRQELNSCPMAGTKGLGILKLSREDREDLHLAYTTQIVDCDGKPSKKLRKRWKKEEPLALLSKSNKD